ncbi:ribonuclease P [Mycena floridula]|nr:ribonuclease P [Mycena floridula]
MPRRLKTSLKPFSGPFTCQIDVLFPSNGPLHSLLSQLKTSFTVIESTLSIINIGDFSGVTLLSANEEDDAWCICDSRLILSVCKDTYQILGLPGKQVSSKGLPERFSIQLSLQSNADSVGNRARRDAAFKAWDISRARRGSSSWKIFCYSRPGTVFQDLQVVKPVFGQSQVSQNIHIPLITLAPQAGSADDWNEYVASLFEWVGLACLGSQRLQVNDNVDPYVAQYEPPSPRETGEVVHVRWKGFFGPDFVRQVVETAMKLEEKSPQFVAINAHSCRWSPIIYDTWSVLLQKGEKGWMVVESS